MASEDHTHACSPGCGQRRLAPFGNASTIPDLTADANLHVVDEQCRSSGIAKIFESHWNGQVVDPFHFVLASN
jgi:hypothetical protein